MNNPQNGTSKLTFREQLERVVDLSPESIFAFVTKDVVKSGLYQTAYVEDVLQHDYI